MDRYELVHVLTLWFAAGIFLQTTSSSSDSPVLQVMAALAVSLVFLLPLWLLIELVSDFLVEIMERRSVEE